MVTDTCVMVEEDTTNAAGVALSAGDYYSPGDSMLSGVPEKLLHNECTTHPLVAVAFFCLFIIMCTLIIINLVVGAILQYQGQRSSEALLPVRKADVEEFFFCWSELDPGATGWIPATDLAVLLAEMPPPLGVHGLENNRAQLTRIIMAMDIPIRDYGPRNGQIHYLETLHALAGMVAGTELPEAQAIKSLDDLAKWLPATGEYPRWSASHAYAGLYVAAAVRGFLCRETMRAQVTLPGSNSMPKPADEEGGPPP